MHLDLENSNSYYTMATPSSRGALETIFIATRDEGHITEFPLTLRFRVTPDVSPASLLSKGVISNV
jgi:hypothetical protein